MAGLAIVNGGNSAGITRAGQLEVISENHTLEFHHSFANGGAFQLIGDFASVNNATHAALHLRNSASDKILIINSVRAQFLDFAGGTAVPNAASYMSIGQGRTYTSGGTDVSANAFQLNQTSGETASIVAYDNNPTLGGTFKEIYRHYVREEAEELIWESLGTIILGQNHTFEVQVTSNHTSGVVSCEVSFLQIDPKLLKA